VRLVASLKEMRARAIEVMAMAMCNVHGGETPWQDLVEGAGAAFDALGAAGFIVLGPKYTEEQLLAGLNSYSEPLTAFETIAAAGDLARKPE